MCFHLTSTGPSITLGGETRIWCKYVQQHCRVVRGEACAGFRHCNVFEHSRFMTQYGLERRLINCKAPSTYHFICIRAKNNTPSHSDFVNMSRQGMQERGRESGGGMFIKTKSYTQRKGKIKTARAGWWTIVTWSHKRCLWMFYSQDISTPETSHRAWPC